MNNQEFWNNRYSMYRKLGSGPGSRGYCAWYKKEVVENIIREKKINSIVDVGCGDIEVMPHEVLVDIKYRGLDLSGEIVNNNLKDNKTNYKFEVFDVTKQSIKGKCDLLICLDVLLHQTTYPDLYFSVKNLMSTKFKYALISYPVDGSSQATNFNIEELPESVVKDEKELQEYLTRNNNIEVCGTEWFGRFENFARGFRKDISIKELGQYRNQQLYYIEKNDIDFKNIWGLR